MRVIMTCGGTGGHIYPAVAIADEIKRREPDSDILFVGSQIGLEKDLVPKSGYEIRFITAGWLDRKNIIKNVKLPLTLMEVSGLGSSCTVTVICAVENPPLTSMPARIT